MFDFVTKQLLHLSVACRGGGANEATPGHPSQGASKE